MNIIDSALLIVASETVHIVKGEVSLDCQSVVKQYVGAVDLTTPVCP